MSMPPMPDLSDISDRMTQIVRQHRSRFAVLGAALIVLGFLSILFPLLSSIAVKIAIGWFFLLSGAAMLYAAFQLSEWTSALWTGLIGGLQIVAGVYLAFFPLTGLIGLTFFIGLVFLIQGTAEAAIAWQYRPRTGWLWLVLSAVASLALGVLLIAGLPDTALWALGMFLGINLISSGASFVALARTA